MAMTASGMGGRVSEINVTPLIDVLLVLLIIFMVIVPVAPKGMDAEVPQPLRNDAASTPSREVIVELRSRPDGSVAYQINRTDFAKADLGPELRTIFERRDDKQMFVKGDQDLDFMQVSEVIDAAHKAGVDRVGIITPGSEAGR